MRNLKKLISLLLVVAMIASLGIAGIFTASAAEEEVSAYTAQSRIILQTGIMEGYPDGTIGYQKPVTRAEAAAIIARTMLGVDIAADLKPSEVTFTDVPAWAAGYVGYLAKNNVVNGKSETTFDPNGNVTGVEFGKMLLCALGYGKNGEYVGSNWDVNTLVDAKDLGLYNVNGAYIGLYGVDLTAPATREQCMVYCFNALTSYKVVFDTRYNQYSRYANTQASERERYEYVKLGDIHGVDQSSSLDEFGRTINTYTCGLYTLEIAATPRWTGNEINSDVLYEIFGKNAAEVLSTYGITVFVDGVPQDVTVNDVLKGEIGVNKYAGNGAHVEVYGYGFPFTTEYIRGQIDKFDYNWYTSAKIVIYYEKASQVVRVATNKNRDTNYTLKNGTVITDNDIKAGVDDYLIYIQGANKIGDTYYPATPEEVRVAEPITGSFDATRYVNKEDAFVIDGKTYFASEKGDVSAFYDDGDPATGTPDVYGDYDVVLDSQGYILAAELVNEVSGDYLYVVAKDAATVTAGWKPFGTDNGGVAIYVAYGNGGTDTLYFNVAYDAAQKAYYTKLFRGDNTKYYLATASDLTKVKAALASGWYGYRIDDSGYVILETLNANYSAQELGGTIAGDGKTVKYGTKVANSATVERIVNENGSITTRTGYSRFKEATGDILYTFNRKDNTMNEIYVYTGASTAASTEDYCYLLDRGLTNARGTEYTFLLQDGSKKIARIDDDLTVGQVYNVTSDNGVYSATAVDQKVVATDWYDVEEEARSGEYVPKAQYTIGKVNATFITTAAIDINGNAVEPLTYDVSRNVVIVDATDTGVTALAEGQGFICHLDKNNEIDIIWIVYVPAE